MREDQIMGLGFSMWFPLGLNKKKAKERYIEFFQNLSSVVPNWDTSSFFDDEGFWVKLVPFEEEIYGEWKDGKLCVSARTNSAGPGYHAYLIDLLDGIGIAPLKVEDETGYYQDRNFTLLQEEMTNWLKVLGGNILEMSEDGENKNLAVSLSTDWYPVTEGFTNCPLGHFEKDFFKRMMNGEDTGSEFFIWWNRPQDAAFFKNCAMNLIWCENNWLPPETDPEANIIAATLGCLEKAYALDPGLGYPLAEWSELAQLWKTKGYEPMSDALERLRSSSGDIGEPRCGYKRGQIIQNIRGWHLTRSGMMHYEQDENSDIWWDDDLTIRTSIISVRFDKKVANKSEALLNSVTEEEEDCEPFTLRTPEIAACIQHTQIEEDGELFFQTRLFAALDNELMLMSLYYPDAKDRQRAIDVCASVTRQEK